LEGQIAVARLAEAWIFVYTRFRIRSDPTVVARRQRADNARPLLLAMIRDENRFWEALIEPDLQMFATRSRLARFGARQ
jgi:hypothetical protein